MTVKTLPLDLIRSNCYFIETDRAAIVVDPGFPDDRVTAFLQQNADKDRLILLTHIHFDHIGGAASLQQLTDTPVRIGRYDGEHLGDPDYTLEARFHTTVEAPVIDRFLDDGERFSVGDLTVECFHTPGHSVGGMCYLVGDTLFSGDTLFAGSVGKSDFPGGDAATLIASIRRLFSLPPETVVYPGHGPATILGYEERTNPFLQ